MFEKHKEKKAQEQLAEQQAAWQHGHDELTAVLQAAKTRSGNPSDQIMLKSGEAVFASVTNVSLVEMRRGAGHYEGHSQGVSIPIGSIHGRSIRYRVGANKGHFVSGTPSPTAVDTGTLFVTNQRLIFRGNAKTVECQFTKLIGINQEPGQINISVSNRQKSTVVHYGSTLDNWPNLRLGLALAIYRGEADEFAANIQAQLAELEAKRPQAASPTR